MPLSTRRALRAAIFINQPIQYFAPGLRALAATPGVATTVYYWNAAVDGVVDQSFGHIKWQVDLHSGYRWWSPPTGIAAPRRSLALLEKLRRDRPEAILSFGWHSAVARVGLGYAATTRTPLLLYGDSHPDFSATGKFDRVRPIVLQGLFRMVTGALATGPANRDFYLKHGMPPERIHSGILPADVDLFASAALSAKGRPERSSGKVVIGFAGKFIERKAVDDLLQAVSHLPGDPTWELWLAGDGPLREKLARLAAELRLTERVRFLGFKNLDELPNIMAQVDILVLPSRRDYRPLVVLEAMAAGAATIVSSATGLWGERDVVTDGETGLVFRAGDVEDLTRSIRRLILDPDLRRGIASAGSARARSFGPASFASTTASALAVAAGR